ncbi:MULTISPECIES: hypothetical protein [unclassified Salinibacterium]|uniref:hypothetical protein n=1 Tax=unclassified Salinibacterium TaxID=2632331 RepID=UPI00141F5FA8|nr:MULTISPECIES: hypothetical protein [unclassified Salinibacterium]
MSDVANPAVTERARPSWPGLSLLILFGLLYAYDLWEAIETLVVAPGTFTSVGAPVPWTAFIANTVAPVAAFALAAVLGRRRPLLQKAALLVGGLCLVAVLSLSLTAYVRAGGL